MTIFVKLIKCGKYWLLRSRTGNIGYNREVFIYQFENLGNKAKGRISKQVTRKQSKPNLPKNEHLFLTS